MSKYHPNSKKRIRIGNQTAVSAVSLMEPFIHAVRSGFDAFEWFPDKKDSGPGWTISDISEKMRDHIRATAGKHDISLSVHIPWQANPLYADSQEAFLSHVAFARDLGASCLITHLYLEEGISAYIGAITPLIEETGKDHLGIALENTPETPPEAINTLFEEIKKISSLPSDHMGLCLDVGHANLCRATLNQYVDFVDRLGGHVPIRHIHWHENYGDADSHLPLFTGPAAVDDSGIKALCRRLRQRGFSGNIIFEQWPYPPVLLNQARSKLIEILSASET